VRARAQPAVSVKGWTRQAGGGGRGGEGRGGGGRGEEGGGERERTTTITLKAVRDTPAMVLICRPRFPSPWCHRARIPRGSRDNPNIPSSHHVCQSDPRPRRRLLLRRISFHRCALAPPTRYHQPACGRRLVYLITGM